MKGTAPGGRVRSWLRSWLGLDALEGRLADAAQGHAQLARGAEAHLAGLQAEVERLGLALAAVESRIEQLAGLESGLARLSASQQTLLAQREALRQSVAALRTRLEAIEPPASGLTGGAAGTPR